MRAVNREVSVWQRRWRDLGRVHGLAAAALLGSAPRAAAQSEPAPGAEAGQDAPRAALSIWYRSSEGCPDGAVFVTRLAELGRAATLARVGDRVDFVVTVAAAPDASSGRLERQTARGTVAIRELAAPRCEEVTEALALSLEIALAPADDAAGAAQSGAAAGAAQAAPAAVEATPGAAASAHDAADRAATATPGLARAPTTAPEPGKRNAFQLGAQGSLARGIAPSWAPGGALFAEVRPESEQSLAGRVSLAATLATDTVAAVAVDVVSLAARGEGCALELRAGALSLQPCAGVELGLIRAEGSGGGGRVDGGVWAAGLGIARGSLELGERFALEAQVGAAVPFVRHAVGSSLGGDLFRTEPVVAALALGARWAP